MTFIATDLFCGGGGTSTALVRSVRKHGFELELTAINHDETAIATHKANHPFANHIPYSLDVVKPREVIPGGYLDLMVASPECTYHSNAAGGIPVNDQSRATAWHVIHWAEQLYVDNILIENVPEFRNWGPLDKEKKRIKKSKGQIYLQFIEQLRSLGYVVDDRVINCADYGDPTTRKRLFILARREKSIHWPETTHARADIAVDMFGERLPWRAAREILDLEDRGNLVSQRKRPLAENTMRRIIKGFFKTNGLPFITTTGGPEGQGRNPRSIDEPLSTILSNDRHAIVQPYLVQFNRHTDGIPIDQPVPTITAGGQHLGLATPFLTVYHGDTSENSARVAGLDEPLPTIDTSNRFGLVQPYIVAINHGPNDTRSYPIDSPFPTITTVDAWGIAQPYIVKYYGTGAPVSIDQPLDTITTKDRFGLVTPLIVEMPDGTTYLIDFYFRMLKPSELAGASSFPPGYEFKGTREKIVWQIGNAVPGKTAEALIDTLVEL